MSGHTRRRSLWILGGFCVVAVLAIVTCAWAQEDILAVIVDVSPNVLNLQSNGQVVTVHTDLPYSLVEGGSVLLNGIEIDWWKSDDRGNFVAKFVMAAVKDLALNIDDYNTLTLEGITKYGDMFSGSQEIRVIDNVPAGKK